MLFAYVHLASHYALCYNHSINNKEGFHMPQTISATYEHGVFVPRTPVNLPEHTEVKLLLPKIKATRNKLTEAELGFLSLRGISHNLAGTDSVDMQRSIRGEWHGL